MAQLYNLQYIAQPLDSTRQRQNPFLDSTLSISFAISLIVISFRNIEYREGTS